MSKDTNTLGYKIKEMWHILGKLKRSSKQEALKEFGGSSIEFLNLKEKILEQKKRDLPYEVQVQIKQYLEDDIRKRPVNDLKFDCDMDAGIEIVELYGSYPLRLYERRVKRLSKELFSQRSKNIDPEAIKFYNRFVRQYNSEINSDEEKEEEIFIERSS